MQTPLQITFRHMSSSEALDAHVREHVARLEHFYDRILACHVTVEAPAGHQRQGAPFTIRIDLGVPGAQICARNGHDAHEDVYAALRQTFETAKRLLQDHARRQRGDVKTHANGAAHAGES